MDLADRLHRRTELLRAARILAERAEQFERRFTAREKTALSVLIDVATACVPELEKLDAPTAEKWAD